jgi:proline iminopeptidase
VHGGPDFDHQYLLPDLDRLADRFRLVYYDQRGRGRSFMGEGPDDVTVASEVADLDRVREWNGSERVALLGHSWGGLVALEYALAHPERVSHLLLMNTAPVSHAAMLELHDALVASRTPVEAERMNQLRSDPAYLRGDPAADLAYYRIHFARALYRPAALDRMLARMRAGSTADGIVAARAIEHALYAQTWSREDYDLVPQLRRLRVPALVIHGDHDLIPLDVARPIAAALPVARLVVAPECGHFAYLEQPDLVGRLIDEFLAADPTERTRRR